MTNTLNRRTSREKGCMVCPPNVVICGLTVSPIFLPLIQYFRHYNHGVRFWQQLYGAMAGMINECNAVKLLQFKMNGNP